MPFSPLALVCHLQGLTKKKKKKKKKIFASGIAARYRMNLKSIWFCSDLMRHPDYKTTPARSPLKSLVLLKITLSCTHVTCPKCNREVGARRVQQVHVTNKVLYRCPMCFTHSSFGSIQPFSFLSWYGTFSALYICCMPKYNLCWTGTWTCDE